MVELGYPPRNLEENILFLKRFLSLKDRPRTGWILRGIEKENAETINLHEIRTEYAVTCYLATPTENKKFKHINYSKARIGAKFHDHGETSAPDRTPHENITAYEKYLEQRKSLNLLLYYCNFPELYERKLFTLNLYDTSSMEEMIDLLDIREYVYGAQIINDLFEEYEEKKTNFSQFLTEIDKFAVIPPALEYEDKYPKVKDMYEYARSKISCPCLIDIYDFLMKKEYKELNQQELYHTLLLNSADIELTKRQIEESNTRNFPLFPIAFNRIFETSTEFPFDNRALRNLLNTVTRDLMLRKKQQ